MTQHGKSLRRYAWLMMALWMPGDSATSNRVPSALPAKAVSRFPPYGGPPHSKGDQRGL